MDIINSADREWLKAQIRHLSEENLALRKRITEEMQAHNDLYKELMRRKEFDDWLKEVYPEAIAGYKAAKQLVEFMEDKPQETPKHKFGWDDPWKSLGKTRVDLELELEKLKAEFDAKTKGW